MTCCPKNQHFPPYWWQKPGLERVEIWPAMAVSFSDVLNELQTQPWRSDALWDSFGRRGLENQNRKFQNSKTTTKTLCFYSLLIQTKPLFIDELPVPIPPGLVSMIWQLTQKKWFKPKTYLTFWILGNTLNAYANVRAEGRDLACVLLFGNFFSWCILNNQRYLNLPCTCKNKEKNVPNAMPISG